MSDYSIELHAAYEKILSWYQDCPFYLMFEDDLLSAYDFLYGAMKKYVEEPLPDEELSDEVLAERKCIEELTPLVIKDLNSYLPFAVANPSCDEDENTVSIIEITEEIE